MGSRAAWDPEPRGMPSLGSNSENALLNTICFPLCLSHLLEVLPCVNISKCIGCFTFFVEVGLILSFAHLVKLV
jgi:hypothetical protein